MAGGPGAFRPPHLAPQNNPNNNGRNDGPSDNRQNPYQKGLGYDPAKPPQKASMITNTRVELPSAAYILDAGINTLTSKGVSSQSFLLRHDGVG